MTTTTTDDGNRVPLPTDSDPAYVGINYAEAAILRDIIDHGISPRAITQRRHRTHIDSLIRKGLVKDVHGVSLRESGIVLADEVAALVALGRACGDHDRPLPCLECAND